MDYTTPESAALVGAARQKPSRLQSKRLRFRVLKRDDFTCVYCGRKPGHGIILHIDHVIPLSKGGADEEDNLVTACDRCNLGKATTILDPSKVMSPALRRQLEIKQLQATIREKQAIVEEKWARYFELLDRLDEQSQVRAELLCRYKTYQQSPSQPRPRKAWWNCVRLRF